VNTNETEVVALRRELHRFPELGFLEYRTAALAAARLTELGYAVKAGPEVMARDAMMLPPAEADVAAAQLAAIAAGADAAWIARMPHGQTGLIAELRRGAGPVVAFRFDMDALPVAETEAPTHAPNRLGHRSTRPGAMHACGHDGHTAIGLTVAARLADPASRWAGTLRLIFQPAEEGGRGAWPMVQSGAVDDVEQLYVGHLGCMLPSGEIAAEATGFLYSLKLDAVFEGVAAHAAMGPELGRNALVAGAAAVLGLYGISRHGSEATLVNVGRMVAGTGRNIIASECRLMLEVRGASAAALTYMEGRAREVLAGAALMHGVTHTVEIVGRTAGIVQSPEANAVVAEVAAGLPATRAVRAGWPIGGGDDATFMMQRVQDRGGKAAYFLIGSDLAAVHHANNFDIDEAALAHGVQLFTGIAERVLSPR
jgi:aminobenzoyl-glutamate utilization protein A